MSRTILNSILVVAAALVVGAMTFVPDAAAQDRPFTAHLNGNASLSPTDDPCVMRNDETAEGLANHMGQITWNSVEFVDFCTVPGGVAVTGSFAMIAADGDQLFGTYETIGFVNEDGNLIIHGNYQITGGTGRFEDATGSGDIDAVASLAPGLPFAGSLNGTIDY